MPKHIMGRVTANRKNWDDVACLHVERNHIVGCSYLCIIDWHGCLAQAQLLNQGGPNNNSQLDA
jgi:hypothetical protein